MQTFRQLSGHAAALQSLPLTCHAAATVTRPLSLWLIFDGKPGHENQSLGLAEAIRRRTPCEIHPISLAGKSGLLGRIKAAAAASTNFPKPDLILATGHATHPALLWLARKHQATSIVLMNPSLPLSWFDLCITPAHDFPGGNEAPNLILTRGALNRTQPADGPKNGKLILIGGPSKIHGWDSESIIKQLALATDRGGWELSDSRRTPSDFLDQVRERLPGITAISHNDTPPDWVPQKLQQAKEVWVTEDSVSMIYEALASGARTGLLPTPRLKAKSRVLNGVDNLIADGFLTPFSEWKKTHRLTAAPEPLREADHCAEQVILAISGI